MFHVQQQKTHNRGSWVLCEGRECGGWLILGILVY